MVFVLGTRSKNELIGVHPSLVAVAHEAIKISPVDFSVHDGLRTITEQKEYVRRGVSKTMNSKHMKQSDGFGHAIDLVPYINGKLRWEWEPIYKIAAAVSKVAEQLGVELIWGGVWNHKMSELPDDADGLAAAVQNYIDHRRSSGKSAFIDGPHYELA